MNFQLWQWASWLLRHQAQLPEIMRLGEIVIDKSGKFTFAQQVDAFAAILQIVKTIEADAPVHLFGAADDGDDAEPSEVAALESEAEKCGCGILTLLAVASLLKTLFGKR
jgi:hypothetical protein